MVTLKIEGNGKLWFAGQYPIDCLMGLSTQNGDYATALTLSCPFEGVIDGAFDRCATVALRDVLQEIVPNGLSDATNLARARNELSAAIISCDFLDWVPFVPSYRY